MGSAPRTLIKAEPHIGAKPQLIATARPGGPALSSLPGNDWCQEGISALIPAAAQDGDIHPPERSASESSSYRSAGRLLLSQHCLLLHISFLILDRAFQANSILPWESEPDSALSCSFTDFKPLVLCPPTLIVSRIMSWITCSSDSCYSRGAARGD